MRVLRAMRPRWIYEVVVTARQGDGIAAAPFGVWTDDGTVLRAALFKGSSTLQSILDQRCFVVNCVDDPLVLHHALNRRDQLAFDVIRDGEGAGLPVLDGVPAWLAVRLVRHEDDGNRVLLQAEPIAESATAPGELVNRARGLFLESLVLSTRCRLLGSVATDQLRENARVIAKVAPDSRYEAAIGELLAKVTKQA